MVPMRPHLPVTVLRVTLALVLGHAALLLWVGVRHHTFHGAAHPGILTALAAAELLAAVLFLIPGTIAAGSWCLAAVLIAATLFHLHAGEPPSPIFLVYAAGIWVVAADARSRRRAS